MASTPAPTPQGPPAPTGTVTETTTATVPVTTPAGSPGFIGPVDNEARPGLTSFDPQPVQTPTSTADPAQTTPSNAPALTPPGTVPVPHAPETGTQVVQGWSLENLIGSIQVPDSERAVNHVSLTAEEVSNIASQRRADQQRQAADRRAQQASDRERQQAEAAARAEAEARRANAPRIWVQIATGGNIAALTADCRRLSTRFSQAFDGQTCSTAAWNRNTRLLVGPFQNNAAARTWLNGYSRAGGEGFIWNSEQGEAVTAIGGAANTRASGAAASGAAAGSTTTRGRGGRASTREAATDRAATNARTSDTRSGSTRSSSTRRR